MPDKPNSTYKIVGIVAAVLAVAGLLVCCGCGGLVYWASSAPGASAAALEPFDPTSVPIPPMPDRAAVEPYEVEPGAMLTELQFENSGGPGQSGQVWLYLPPGDHAPGSLPCVLIAPAGTTMLEGMDLGEGDQAEHLPYVHAGFAVVAYSLDGPSFGEFDPAAFNAFRDSMAGLVNARNAVEFVLAKVPEVDPKRIYAAGHSSAGTHALLLAEHEPRLAGAAAYMPAYDVPKRFGWFLRFVEGQLPGATEFAHRSSPKTHADRLNCPVFLYTANDDSNVPAADVRAAAEDLQSRGKDVTIEVAPYGGHYEPMIDSGIPAAIEWMKTKGA
ncbi:MAG TPA: prolyl oligopeptidase family serine peptidase [Pirellulaceae bacterium]|jgi:dipeptidyl aminopeptidase/acylaminoacyl peptidase|nr:prolyl oligopeptidase family serine peptidase [Pirellulaceae bacterium]